VIASCANRIPPDGGPRDRTAPQVLTTSPVQQSLEFIGNKFEFTFDEFVQLKDGGSGIMVSPPVKSPPEATLQGKKLVLRMKELLDSNTTYTITIGNGIVDLTEGNPLEPYSLVFSTGNVIDSLSCMGSVKEAYSGEALKDVLVMLYREYSDSLPKTTLPRYFARTDASGNYKIQNLQAGAYKVFALKDANSNYLYDQTGEMIGFADSILRIDSALTVVQELFLSLEKAPRQRLLKKEYAEPGQIILKYALVPDSIRIFDFTGSPKPFVKSESSLPDSLCVFFSRFQSDSVKLYISNFIDGKENKDTLEFKSRKPVSAAKKGRKAPSSDTTLIVTSNIETKKLLPGERLLLKTNYPSSLSDSASFMWIVAGDTSKTERPKKINEFTFEFNPPAAGGKSVYLFALPGSFVDLYSHINDSLKLDFRTMDFDETGNLEILFTDSAKKPGRVILELTDSKGKMVKSFQVVGRDSLVIESLRPGTFKLRAVDDKNQDGRWTPANYDSKIQAEKVFKYDGDISIRAGWDLAVEFEINLAPGEKKRPDKPASEKK
jgi:uncharacterized protein (DUF2141 family)